MSADAAPRAVIARAKVNLCLHVGARRADGYHDLASLVAFAAIGDTVAVEPAPVLSLIVDGPAAAATPADGDNLVLRAATALRDRAAADGRHVGGAALRLTKVLPVAAGLGGGSSDAAAALHLLNALWALNLPAPDLARLGLTLGADVPVCLRADTSLMDGIGDGVRPGPLLARVPAVLVNPRVPVATGAVFARLEQRRGAVLPAFPAEIATPDALVAALVGTGNDLEPPARGLAPVIGEVLAALTGTPGCRLARMSGSGASCFGLFGSAAAASEAATGLSARGWWAVATTLGG